jgi:bifunctional DNase/RNase
MGIGDSEALAIQLRLEGRRFARPLTHDLIDEVLRELGGRVVKVHIEDLRGGVFFGKVFVETRARRFSLDARASDAVAMALGSAAPIFVARDVIARAAISSADLRAAPPAPGSPGPRSRPRPAEPRAPPTSL